MNMRKERRVVIFFGLSTLLTLLAIIVALYLYDPLQLFHRAWGHAPGIAKNMRTQAAGVIAHTPGYDSVILGTCMMENSSSEEAGRRLGGRFVNLSVADGSYYERAILLEALFRRRKVARVIYSLDVGYYYRQKRYDPRYPPEEYAFLYDRNPLNDIRAYLNSRYLFCLATFSTSEECLGRRITLDRPNAWDNEKIYRQCFGGLRHWAACRSRSKATRSTYETIARTAARLEAGQSLPVTDEINATIDRAKAYIDKYILHFVREEPETRFILVDPPYSRILYAIWAQDNRPKFEVYKAILSYLARQSDRYPNLEVYSFGEEAFLDNLALYKDMVHYDRSVNDWMTEAIAKKRGLLHGATVGKYLERISRKAESFDLIGLNRILRKLQEERAGSSLDTE